jgi:uncharacterized protein with GYD domain
MAKYMWKVHYTLDGARGVVKEGGASRRAFIESLVGGLGGTLETFYFAFGDVDVYVIADLPDDTTAAAVAIAVGTSGAATLETVKLLTPEEMDAARGIETGYRAPGA